MSLESTITRLRGATDPKRTDIPTQQLYERWLKASEWKGRAEAIPLLVGIDPEDWPAYVQASDGRGLEQDLWEAFAKDTGLNAGTDLVPVSTVYEWCRRNSIEVPLSFSRLYDFIRQTTLYAGSPDTEPAGVAAGGTEQEKEIVLGAALSLVSKMPDRCRDQHGFIDGNVVVGLIFETAARWFPAGTPAMTREQMAALIDKWLE